MWKWTNGEKSARTGIVRIDGPALGFASWALSSLGMPNEGTEALIEGLSELIGKQAMEEHRQEVDAGDRWEAIQGRMGCFEIEEARAVKEARLKGLAVKSKPAQRPNESERDFERRKHREEWDQRTAWAESMKAVGKADPRRSAMLRLPDEWRDEPMEWTDKVEKMTMWGELEAGELQSRAPLLKKVAEAAARAKKEWRAAGLPSEALEAAKWAKISAVIEQGRLERKERQDLSGGMWAVASIDEEEGLMWKSPNASWMRQIGRAKVFESREAAAEWAGRYGGEGAGLVRLDWVIAAVEPVREGGRLDGELGELAARLESQQLSQAARGAEAESQRQADPSEKPLAGGQPRKARRM